MDPDDAALLDQWRAAHAAPVRGYDLSELDDRIVEDDPEPWSYQNLARTVLGGAEAVLDLGTGGGEILLDLLSALPADTVATEGWAPNLPVATATLATPCIPVVAYDAAVDDALPFISGRFDVVLARHAAYVASEVYRVLRPGGRFLTEQVDGRDLEEIDAVLGGRPAHRGIRLDALRAEALAAGFQLIADEESTGQRTFSDVTALVRYLAFEPWQVPEDFTVDRYARQLLALHHDGRPLTFTRARFCLIAIRPY